MFVFFYFLYLKADGCLTHLQGGKGVEGPQGLKVLC